MKVLTLKRFTENPFGTFGVLYDDTFICATLERNWQDNKHDVSCIPIGEYTCKRITSPRFGDTFEVTNVPNRTEVLLHKGNFMNDSHGCILLAAGFAWINNQLAISNCGDAWTWFHSHLKGENEFKLVINSI